MAGNGKVGNLFFGINLDSKEFKKGMRQVKRNMKQFQKDMKNGFATVAKGATALTAGITGLTAGAFALAKQTSELVNSQNILAESLGSTQAEIAGLELASDSMGVSYDMLIDKMREFGGVDEFKKLADDVANAGDETMQLAKAQEIFGNEGLKLLPILQQGSQGLNDYVEEARRLGLALTPDQVDQMTGAWGKYEKMMQKITGATRQFGVIFSDEFGKWAEKLGDIISNNLPQLVAGVGIVWESFKVWFENMAIGVDVVLDAFGDMTDGVLDEFTTQEKIIVGIANPFETILFTLGKLTEKFLSILSFPIRKLAEFFAWTIKQMSRVAEALIKLFPGDGGAPAKFMKKVTEAAQEVQDEFRGDEFTGAFDGLLFGDTQDAYISKFKKTVGRIRSEAKKFSFARLKDQVNNSVNRESTGAESGKADTEAKIGGMATLAVAGSIEAFKLENQTENQILDVNRQQLRELKNMSRQQQLQFAGFTN